MSGPVRVMVGALLGALAVLLAFPNSRRSLTAVFANFGESATLAASPVIPDNGDPLPAPVTAQAAGMWTLASAQRIPYRPVERGIGEPGEARGGYFLGSADMLRLAAITRQAGVENPNNAFWPQYTAALLMAVGRDSEAEAEWRRASKCDRWNDMQTERLLALMKEMRESHGPASWQPFALLALRSTEPAAAIERVAHTFATTAGFDTPSALSLRFATLVNGRLMREGSRNLAIGRLGAGIVEMATFPRDMTSTPSQKALWQARYALVNALRAAGLTGEADLADEAFRSNDGWIYLTGAERPWDRARWLTLASLLAGTVPSALLGLSAIGLVFWLLGVALLKFPWTQTPFTFPLAPVIGCAAGVAIYWRFGLAIVALSATLAFGFVTFSPKNARTHPSEDLGPFFRSGVAVIGCVFGCLACLWFIGASSPGIALLPRLGLSPALIGGSGTLIGLAGTDLGLLMVLAPSWGLVRSLRTPWVLSLGIRNLGRGLCLVPASLAAVCAVIALSAEQRLDEIGTKLLENEPVYYLSQ